MTESALRRPRHSSRLACMSRCLCLVVLWCHSYAFLLGERPQRKHGQFVLPLPSSDIFTALGMATDKRGEAAAAAAATGYRLGLFPYRTRVPKRQPGSMVSKPSSVMIPPTVTSVLKATDTNSSQVGERHTAATDVDQDTSSMDRFLRNETKIIANHNVLNSTNVTRMTKEPEVRQTVTSNRTQVANANNTEPSWQDKYFPLYRGQRSPVASKAKIQGSESSIKVSGVADESKSKPAPRTKLPAGDEAKNKQRASKVPFDKAPDILSLVGKELSDVLTVQDLQYILTSNGFVRRSELDASQQTRATTDGDLLAGLGQPVRPSGSAQTPKTPSGVAFPQPSVLSYENVKWGSAVSAGILGLICGLSLNPNLWLMGALAGGLYGWETGKRLQISQQPPGNTLTALIVNFGRKLAKAFLLCFDAFNAIFFMYKTGQLSLEYYKRYADLDKRFQVQSKIDAWNARFTEGKVVFDKWERDNEVGRKALAMTRAIWLVEERSLEKGRKRTQRQLSKYRVVQVFYDVAFSVGRFLGSVGKFLTGGGSSELQEFLRGLRIDMSDETRLNEIGMRIGAAVSALIAVNVTGALFSISPVFLGLLAAVVGILWPSWVTELFDRISRFFMDTRAKGRGEDPVSNAFSQLTGRFDKSRYHYFVDLNGKKRYYRTGQPRPGAGILGQPKKKASASGKRPWPWQAQ